MYDNQMYYKFHVLLMVSRRPYFFLYGIKLEISALKKSLYISYLASFCRNVKKIDTLHYSYLYL